VLTFRNVSYHAYNATMRDAVVDAIAKAAGVSTANVHVHGVSSRGLLQTFQNTIRVTVYGTEQLDVAKLHAVLDCGVDITWEHRHSVRVRRMSDIPIASLAGK
jgi:hypothetical protein